MSILGGHPWRDSPEFVPEKGAHDADLDLPFSRLRLEPRSALSRCRCDSPDRGRTSKICSVAKVGAGKRALSERPFPDRIPANQTSGLAINNPHTQHPMEADPQTYPSSTLHVFLIVPMPPVFRTGVAHKPLPRRSRAAPTPLPRRSRAVFFVLGGCGGTQRPLPRGTCSACPS